jgi:hypothetical protein
VWALNLVCIFDPANGYFTGFGATAASVEGTSLGGSAFPTFVAAHPLVFSLVIAVVTLYLAIAFLFGVSTRAACIVGTVFALALLVSQFGSTFVIGGTDVGPMPIYVAVFGALFFGHAERTLSFDAGWSARAQRNRAPVPLSQPGPRAAP